MVETGLPYITSGVGLPILLQPYAFNDAKMGVFFLDCREEALNGLLDRYINTPSLGQMAYRCLASDGKAVAFMIMAGMTVNVRNTDGRECGKEPYSELSFWIPCWDAASNKAALFLPFLFPDSFSAIATGREMFGFRKTPASFTFPNGSWDPLDPRFTASARGFTTFGPEQIAETLEFLSVAELGGRSPRSVLGAAAALVEHGIHAAADTVERGIGDVLAAMERGVGKALDAATGDRTFSGGLVAGALSNGEFLKGLARQLGKAEATAGIGNPLLPLLNRFLALCPSIFIKQFPAVTGAQEAEVRDFTAAPFQLQALRGGFPWITLGLPPKLTTYALTFTNLASHPIAEELGLSAGTADAGTTVVNAHGLWLDVDFSLETGTTVATVKSGQTGSGRKTKIAVLGGGIGSLAAVYGITQTPGWQDKYEITVYQVGWRVGGKGASGRNREIADRIEEHGLHIWFGYYENSFRVIRECYEALARPANTPLASWDMAFKPHNSIVVEEYVGDRVHLGGPWSPWYCPFGPTPGTPGEGTPRDDRPAVWLPHTRDILGQVSSLLRHPLLDDATRDELVARHLTGHALTESGTATGSTDLLTALIDHLPKTADEAHSFGRSLVGDILNDRSDNSVFERILAFIKDLGAALIEKLEEMLASIGDRLEPTIKALLAPFGEAIDSVYRILTMAELAIVIAKGVILDGVLTGGYTAIDQYDFTEWLIRNGASETAANSVLVRAFYDLYLGFPNGKSTVTNGVATGGNVAAGELLHSYILVVLCYKGSIMWKMQAGMGDTVMTPMYQVLKQSGVRFEFFHKVTNLGLDTPAAGESDGETARSIDSISIDVQATPKPDVREYNPLYDVKGLPCWPSEPLYEQLVQGQELRDRRIDLESSWSPWQPVARKTLKRGEDFDQVVLGISVAALPAITPELMAASEGWNSMLAKSTTTQTQAMQLWMNIVLEETGWPLPSPILDAYAEPFNTWAAMDQTLDKENWPQSALPFGIAYLCNNLDQVDPIPPYTDHGYPARAVERVKEDARAWLKTNAAQLWPTAVQADGTFDWSKLVDMRNRPGEARLDAQYFRANVEPTERYVCNAADTNQYRLKTDGSDFGNLFLTGDWIDNGSLNLGCVESTVIAGLQAARALTGYPLPIARVDVVNANTEPAPAPGDAKADLVPAE